MKMKSLYWRNNVTLHVLCLVNSLDYIVDPCTSHHIPVYSSSDCFWICIKSKCSFGSFSCSAWHPQTRHISTSSRDLLEISLQRVFWFKIKVCSIFKWNATGMTFLAVKVKRTHLWKEYASYLVRIHYYCDENPGLFDISCYM